MGRIRAVAFAAVALCVASGFSRAASSGDAEADGISVKVQATLQSRYPETRILSVRAAPQWPGLYEVVTRNGIAYSDADANYLLAGNIIDTRTQANITDARWNELQRVDVAALPVELAVKSVRGDGSRKLVLFEDPDCPFCERLEQQIKDVSDVTIYTFLYPLESLHPDARQKAVSIWCARDRAAAWSDWMLRRVAPPAAVCVDEPSARVIQLGEGLGIDATPTLVFADGSRAEGALTAGQLQARLAASGKAQ